MTIDFGREVFNYKWGHRGCDLRASGLSAGMRGGLNLTGTGRWRRKRSEKEEKAEEHNAQE
jgi:hypothetical protein